MYIAPTLNLLSGLTGVCANAGNAGLKLVLGGEKGDLGSSGGSDSDTLDFRSADLRGFGFDSLIGDDSPPDWKILLSSHPESSVPGPNCGIFRSRSRQRTDLPHLS